MQVNGVNNKERQCSLVLSDVLDMPLRQGSLCSGFQTCVLSVGQASGAFAGILAFSLFNPFPPSLSTV